MRGPCPASPLAGDDDQLLIAAVGEGRLVIFGLGLELLLGARAQARRFDQALGLIEQDPSRVSQTVIHDICVSALVDAFDAASLARERVTAVEARCALLPDEPRIDREAAQLLARTVIDDRLDLERWTDLATRLDGLVDSELDDAETDMTGELLLRTALYGLATVAPEQRGDLLVAQLQLLDAVELRTALGDWYIWRIGVMANEDRELATRCADLLLTDAVLIEDAARHAADDLRADLAAPGETGETGETSETGETGETSETGETGEDTAENADGSTAPPTGTPDQVPTEAPTDAHTDAHTARPCPLPVPPQP